MTGLIETTFGSFASFAIFEASIRRDTRLVARWVSPRTRTLASIRFALAMNSLCWALTLRIWADWAAAPSAARSTDGAALRRTTTRCGPRAAVRLVWTLSLSVALLIGCVELR